MDYTDYGLSHEMTAAINVRKHTKKFQKDSTVDVIRVEIPIETPVQGIKIIRRRDKSGLNHIKIFSA